MLSITVNDRTIPADSGETILSSCRRAGIKIPTLCNHPALPPTGTCRLCVVEVKGQRNLVPACAFPVQNGMQIQTHSARAVEARRTIVELLLANHPDDCLYCHRNGNCELQNLAQELSIHERRFHGARNPGNLDSSSPAILRDPSKCILCGKCVRVCEEIQGVGAIDFIGRGSKTVIGTAFNHGLNVSTCVACGQCITVCPTGALGDRSQVEEVIDALNDPEKIVVVQHAPSVSVTIGELLDMPAGNDMAGVMNAALKRLGFARVFDTSFSADLTIMEEASELVSRITKGTGPLPMMTTCSPGWVRFVEQTYPELIPNLSSCKSPQQMLGALVKTYWAEKEGIDPKKIYHVSIMPCTAKKLEAERPELSHDGVADIDAVLTTRELVRLFKMMGLTKITELEPQIPDLPFGERSSAGKLFGSSGGVMEAAVRTAQYLITGQNGSNEPLEALRGDNPRKIVKINIAGMEIGLAVVSGLMQARALLDEIKAGRTDIHFIEVMTCPGGCIAGGGQPIGTDHDVIKARMSALYKIDSDSQLRTSHENESIKKLYKDYLGEPLSPTSHHLLHTKYHKRDTI